MPPPAPLDGVSPALCGAIDSLGPSTPFPLPSRGMSGAETKRCSPLVSVKLLIKPAAGWPCR